MDRINLHITDTKWLRQIGFRTRISLEHEEEKRRQSMGRSGQQDVTFHMANGAGLLVLWYDIERLNKLEDEYVKKTGKTPPIA